MKNRLVTRILVLIVMTILLLCAAGAASAMEITLDEYHSPSEDLVGPGEGLAYEDNGNGSFAEVRTTPEAADYSSLWIGEYVLKDEPDSILSITPGEGGKLHMFAFFLRMTGIEAEIDPIDDEALRFIDNDSAYYGGIHRERDGAIRLAVYGGHDMGPDGAIREFFLGNDFYFYRNGTQGGEDEGDILRRLAGGGYTTAAQPGSQYRNSDTYEFSPKGTLQSWTHYDYHEEGYTTTKRSYSTMYVDEYDRNGNHTERKQYENGVIKNAEIYARDADGKLICKHTKRYDDSSIEHIYEYYEYDASGRQLYTVYVNPDGTQGVTERYEYFEDGTKVRRTYLASGKNAGRVSTETWYDSKGREIRFISYHADGSIYLQNDTEYVTDANGRVVQRTAVTTTDDGSVYRTVLDREFSPDGKIDRETESTPMYFQTVHRAYFRNGAGKTIYRYEMTEYDGDHPSVSVDDTEYVYDQSGTEQMVSRDYSYTSAYGSGEREEQKITFIMQEDERGNRLGISPLPQKGNGEIFYLIMDDFPYAFRELGRDDVTAIYHAYAVDDCTYDSTDRFDLCGHVGALRFVFGGRYSNRLQSVWWVCNDDDAAVYRLAQELADQRVDWYSSGSSERPNPAGLTERTGSFEEDTYTLASGSRGGQPLVWLCCSYNWYTPEDGQILPWKSEQYAAYVPGVQTTPVPVITEAPVPEITAEPEPAPEPETEPESVSEPEPDGETEIPAGEWVDCWMSGGDEMGEMITYLKEDGSLWMKAFFLRTFEIEVELKPLDRNRRSFETEYGHYSGVVTWVNERELNFAITGGMSMEDDENEYYYLFKDRDFTFTPVDYNDLWYEAPAEGPEDDSDWTGNWTTLGTDMKSTIRIIRGVQGNFIMQLTFSNGYMIAGELEQADSRRMDFNTEEFSAILTLNRKHRMILLTDAGSMNDAANEALDAFHYIIEYSPEVYE